MEAMTQEFMLHRRPHVEIWSTREGSDDDTAKIHLRHKHSDGSQTKSTKNKGSTSDTKIWWIPNPNLNHGPLQKPKSEENPNHKPKDNKKVHLRHQRLMDLDKQS